MRRTSCVNNLKNLALAAINHHDQQGAFPIDEDYFSSNSVQEVDLDALTYTWKGRNILGGVPAEGLDGGGWIVRILPYLEQQALFDRFNIPGHGLNGNWNDRSNLGMNYTLDPTFRAAVETQPAVLACPSDENGGLQPKQYPYSDSSVPFGERAPRGDHLLQGECW